MTYLLAVVTWSSLRQLCVVLGTCYNNIVSRSIISLHSSSSFLSFHQVSYVSQIVPSQCLAQSMAMSLAVVRSWGEQAVSIMGQTSRCCVVCLIPQSQVSCSLENPHFNMFTLDRPTCVRNRLSAFQVVQGLSAPAGRCSSALMLRCILAYRC